MNVQIELLPQRLAAKIEPEPTSGCWLWTGAIGTEGYGLVWWEGRSRGAHRVVMDLLDPIGTGDEPDHLCRNRACVSPWHMEAVTHQVNVARAPSPQGAKSHCPKGHPYDEVNTYRVGSTGHRQCRACRTERNRARYL